MSIGPSVEFKRRQRKTVLRRLCGAVVILLVIIGLWAVLTWKKHKGPAWPHGVEVSTSYRST